MSEDTEPKPVDTAPQSNVVLRKNTSVRRSEESAQRVRRRLSRFPCAAAWSKWLALLLIGAVAISTGSADTTTDRVLLPVEIVGTDGTTASRTVALKAGQAESVRSLWLQIHGLRYSAQASI
jgi:hypothetical protein